MTEGPAAQGGPVAVVLPHREAFGPGRAGAVSMVVRRLVTGASRYRAVVLGPAFDGAPFPGVAFHPVTVARWPALSPTRAYARAVGDVLAGLPPGLIEVHNKPDVALRLARRFPDRPVCLFLHNDPRSMRGARSARARAALAGRLSDVVAVSHYIADAAGHGAGVLHNAIDLAELPAPVAPGARDRVLLFAGRVVADKGPDAFIAACALALPRLPGWRAEIIGADGFSPGSPETAFIRTLRPAAAQAGVAMRGFMPHDEVMRALSRAAVAVVPSRWAEPFGLAALEAMACGAALACSRRGGLAEVAGDCCIAINPDDMTGFADALVRLGQDPDLRARLSACGRSRAATQFSTQEAIRQLDLRRHRKPKLDGRL